MRYLAYRLGEQTADKQSVRAESAAPVGHNNLEVLIEEKSYEPTKHTTGLFEDRASDGALYATASAGC
jgi:hypothetical protein